MRRLSLVSVCCVSACCVLTIVAPRVASPQELPAPDARVREVLSGGLWSSASRHGTYRVVIYQVGWDHAYSRLYVEWIEQLPDSHAVRLAARREPDPFARQQLALAHPDLAFTAGRWHVHVRSTDPDGSQPAQWDLELGGPDTVTVGARPGTP